MQGWRRPRRRRVAWPPGPRAWPQPGACTLRACLQAEDAQCVHHIVALLPHIVNTGNDVLQSGKRTAGMLRQRGRGAGGKKLCGNAEQLHGMVLPWHGSICVAAGVARPHLRQHAARSTHSVAEVRAGAQAKLVPQEPIQDLGAVVRLHVQMNNAC